MNGIRDKNTVIVGSRKSQLALIQTRFVIASLKEQYPAKNFEIVAMSTLGDAVQDRPLPKIGEKSVFTRELETALDTQQVDLVVHSLKDLPTSLPGGLSIGAVLRRDDARDAVVLAPRHAHLMSATPPSAGVTAHSLRSLPAGSVVGTSSLRRAAQLQRSHPGLKVTSIRGNLNTRLAKLDKEAGEFDAVVLAAAGLERMGWSQRISQTLPEEEMLYAVGQGALAVECREDDFASLRLLECLHHAATALRVLAERSFLRTLEGGCSAPVAVISSLEDGLLSLSGAVWSLDGQDTLRHSMATRVQHRDDQEPPRKCPYRTPRLFCSMSPVSAGHSDLEAAELLGDAVARTLIDRGAMKIMAAAKSTYLAKTFLPTIEVASSATFQPVLDVGFGAKFEAKDVGGSGSNATKISAPELGRTFLPAVEATSSATFRPEFGFPNSFEVKDVGFGGDFEVKNGGAGSNSNGAKPETNFPTEIFRFGAETSPDAADLASAALEVKDGQPGLATNADKSSGDSEKATKQADLATQVQRSSTQTGDRSETKQALDLGV